ncbi:MAG: orotidine-5'-phosphate decarboxylase [Oligoflexia bacterium]|jgi:orotidine-5'-phosphate decarboxylase
MKRAAHQTDLILALDYPREDQALKLVEQLGDEPIIYKVGLELFLAAGPSLVRELVHQKKRVFLDLKFHDIPNTVSKAALQAALLHVEMFTLHLAGGSAMLHAVRDALHEVESLKPKVIGVSVLTSFDDLRWAEVSRAINGHASEIASSVGGLVDSFAQEGIDGIVCSPWELEAIRERHPGLYTVVPGIRPEGTGSAGDDQARVWTPERAARAGASAIVVGRPITQAPDAAHAARALLRSLAQIKAAV